MEGRQGKEGEEVTGCIGKKQNESVICVMGGKLAKVGNCHPTPRLSLKLAFAEYH
jgi:hypothetical protein